MPPDTRLNATTEARMASGSPGETVSFTEMQHGTATDYALLDGFERQHAVGLAGRLLGVVDRLDDSLGGYQISRKEHSLQSATRARRAGADIDWVVAALLHDIGDDLAPYNHAEYAAAVLRPYVREEISWVIEHHGVFQSYYFAHHLGGDRDRREEFRDHPWFDLCVEFCAEWDQNSFDPAGPIDDLASFADDVHTVFARPAWDASIVAAGSAKLVA
jgi:predicted HD phosphohydrolase